MRILASIFFLIESLAFAYLPPVGVMIRESCAGRKNTGVLEVVMGHKVRLSAESEGISIRERIVRDKGQVFFGWTFADGGWSGTWNGKEYRLANAKTFVSDTKAFLRVLLSVVPEELQAALIGEQFVRKDQLYQYKPDFKFEGEPTQWNIKENYLVPIDVSLQRSPTAILFAVNGYADGKNRRTVFFEKELRGVARLEWQSDSGTTAWNFSNHSPQPIGGHFPRVLTFESAGVVIVESVLETARVLTAAQLKEAKKQLSSTPSGFESNEGESALKILLSFR